MSPQTNLRPTVARETATERPPLPFSYRIDSRHPLPSEAGHGNPACEAAKPSSAASHETSHPFGEVGPGQPQTPILNAPDLLAEHHVRDLIDQVQQRAERLAWRESNVAVREAAIDQRERQCRLLERDRRAMLQEETVVWTRLNEQWRREVRRLAFQQRYGITESVPSA